jgi:2-dehydropantoate 2-reductase
MTDGSIYIMGGGAIGMALAASLVRAGRRAVLVRTRDGGSAEGVLGVTVRGAEGEEWSVAVETVRLADLVQPQGIIVVTSKSHANAAIAAALLEKNAAGPVVVLQNGMGVEAPFLEAGFDVYRCILYVTGQMVSEAVLDFRPVASCPIGVIRGNQRELKDCVQSLDTPFFPFHLEEAIQRDIWKKTIINSVFNAICPILEVDNGIFSRDPQAMELAEEVLGECALLAERHGIHLPKVELIENVLRISRSSSGVFISTLQDIRNGNRTEMDSLNMELARAAAAARPPLDLTRTELLGRLTLLKSEQTMLRQIKG